MSGKLTFGTVCDGIGCGHLAFDNAGFECAWSFEIEPFPSAVLAYRFPDVPNYGDMNKAVGMIERGEIAAPDVFIGGTPCQSWSVAGKRKGMDDERGNLSLVFCRIVDAIDAVRSRAGKTPCAVCWENVPGVFSDKGNGFGCILGELSGAGCQLQPPGGRWRNAGCVSGPKRDLAWRVLDSQHFGVPQRRRRVFVVAGAGGFRPEQVLFERDGLRGHSAPGGEAREGTADGITGCLTACGGQGGRTDKIPTVAVNVQGCEFGPGGGSFSETSPTLDTHAQDGPIRNQGGAAVAVHTTGAGDWQEGCGTLWAREQDSHESLMVVGKWPADIAPTLNAHFGDTQGLEDQHVNGGCPLFVPDIPPIAIQDVRSVDKRQNGKGYNEEGQAYTVDAMATQGVAVAFEKRFVRTTGGQPSVELQPCLRADTNSGDGAPCVAVGSFLETTGHQGDRVVSPGNVSLTLSANGGNNGGGGGQLLHHAMQIRRLLPEECEKLQALPRGWTRIPWRIYQEAGRKGVSYESILLARGKHLAGPAIDDCPDGPRYKGIGNGQTVSVMEWIARRMRAEMEKPV